MLKFLFYKACFLPVKCYTGIQPAQQGSGVLLPLQQYFSICSYSKKPRKGVNVLNFSNNAPKIILQ